MDRYPETAATWNKLAQLYQDKFMDLDLYNDSYDFFCASIPTSNASILDIGCGPGNISRYLLSKRPDFQILGIDTAPAMIELAKLNIPSAHFRVMDCRQISTLNARFDGIICGFCLPYLEPADAEKLMADTYGLLVDNGLLYLSFVEDDPVQSGYQTGSTGDRIYFNYYKLEDLQNTLDRCGFKELGVSHVLYETSSGENISHTILTARK